MIQMACSQTKTYASEETDLYVLRTDDGLLRLMHSQHLLICLGKPENCAALRRLLEFVESNELQRIKCGTA